MTGEEARKTLDDSLVGEIAINHRELFAPEGGNIYNGLESIINDYL